MEIKLIRLRLTWLEFFRATTTGVVFLATPMCRVLTKVWFNALLQSLKRIVLRQVFQQPDRGGKLIPIPVFMSRWHYRSFTYILCSVCYRFARHRGRIVSKRQSCGGISHE